MDEIRSLLAEIHAIYRDAGLVVFEYDVIEPATPSALDAFEQRLGAKLPDDYRAFLLANDYAHSFDGNFRCLDLAGVIRSWETMKGLLDAGTFDDGRASDTALSDDAGSAKIRPCWWSPLWIPISKDSCANTKCIDLDPGPRGVRGQIVAMEVQDGQGPFPSEYDSFTAYLRDHLQLLREGRFTVSEEGIEMDRYRPARHAR